MSVLRLTVAGVSGKMGRALVRAVAQMPGVTLSAALARPGSQLLGQDSGALSGIEALNIPITDNVSAALAQSDCVLDFTSPQYSLMLSKMASREKVVHVIGTTGFSKEDLEALAMHAYETAIVRSGNMSLGVNLLAVLVRRVAKTLDENFDIEVLEMHHRHKVDAPSGTALLLGEAAAEGRNINLKEHAQRVRDGHTGARAAGDIGFATLRGGSVIGDHSVIFAGEGERIELSHKADDRAIFARGAVKAAIWGSKQPPGLYSMMDVLGVADI